jgi:hypothetical protein
MIWQNVWAWIGLVSLAVPVLIHLLSRRSARVQPFPTLRFLDSSLLPPIRRARLRDALLLALRLGILAFAVAALAQPLLFTPDRERELEAVLSRAIVLDTSASMQRSTVNGDRAIDAARREVDSLVAAGAFVLLESATPAQMLAGAVAWLHTQPGRREIVVVSDFQVGAIDALDLESVPAGFGTRFRSIDVVQADTPIEWSTPVGAMQTLARITLLADRTDVEWTIPEQRDVSEDGLLQLAAPEERASADAALQAAIAAGAPTRTTGIQPVAIVHPRFGQRDRLMAEAEPLNAAWMADVLIHVANDATLAAAAAELPAISGDSANAQPIVTSPNLAMSAPFTLVGRTPSGRAVARVARGVVDGRERLLFFSLVDARSLVSAALAGAILRAQTTAVPVTELEPGRVPDEVLREWERSPSSIAPDGTRITVTDARWFWIVALLLLALETWVRRPRGARHETGIVNEPMA